MKNIEIIKYYANKRPDLLGYFLDDIYCIGFNDGNRAAFIKEYEDFEETILNLDAEWLFSEYKEDFLFNKEDVDKIRKE